MSGSCLKSFLKSSFLCLYVGLNTCKEKGSGEERGSQGTGEWSGEKTPRVQEEKGTEALGEGEARIPSQPSHGRVWVLVQGVRGRGEPDWEEQIQAGKAAALPAEKFSLPAIKHCPRHSVCSACISPQEWHSYPRKWGVTKKRGIYPRK